MEARAAAFEYEEAARLRDRLRAIEKTLEKQRATRHGRDDSDVFGIYREGAAIVVGQLFVRGGAITGQRIYPFTNLEDDDGQVLRQLLGVYYTGGAIMPAHVLLPVELEGGNEPFAEWLSDLAGRQIEVRVVQRGEGRELVELATTNAQRHFAARRHTLAAPTDVLGDLQTKLHLPRLPETIECFDVSNVQGKLAVASQVRFAQGEPDKSGYRRYRIRTKQEPDDYAMLREALTRRLRRAPTADDRPDLLLIDGGRGHLNVALTALREAGHADQPTAAIAKIKDLAPGDAGPADKIYLPGRKNAVLFRPGSHALHLLQRIRDEAHRFAIEYHRRLRRRHLVASELDAIAGVGPAKKRALLRAFGSVKRVREAARDDLAKVPGIGARLADTLFRHLHRDE
jgi:excinuclease ABC subunit C